MTLKATGAGSRRSMMIAALSSALALTACAVASPFAVNSTGAGLPAQATVAIIAAEDDVGQRARMAEALGEAFAARQISTADTGRYLAEYSIAVRDAAGGLTTSAAAGVDDIDWDSRPRDKRLLDGCDAQRMRATLALLDRESGGLIYRGEGEAVDCAFSDRAIADVAEQLVADALARSRP